jgi:hypothetical protein
MEMPERAEQASVAVNACLRAKGFSDSNVEILMSLLRIDITDSDVTLLIERLSVGGTFSGACDHDDVDAIARAFVTMLVDELKELAGRSHLGSVADVVLALGGGD